MRLRSASFAVLGICLGLLLQMGVVGAPSAPMANATESKVSVVVSIPKVLEPTLVSVPTGTTLVDAMAAALTVAFPAGNSRGTWYIDMTPNNFVNYTGVDPSGNLSGIVSTTSAYPGWGQYWINGYYSDRSVVQWQVSDGEVVIWDERLASENTAHQVTTQFVPRNMAVANKELVWAIGKLRACGISDVTLAAQGFATSATSAMTLPQAKVLYPGVNLTWGLDVALTTSLNSVRDAILAIGLNPVGNPDRVSAARAQYRQMPKPSGSSGYLLYLFQNVEPYAAAYQTLLAAENAVNTGVNPQPEAGLPTSAAAINARKTAASWLAGQLATNGGVLDYGGATDWGLTIDSMLALAGAQVAGEQLAKTATAIYRSGTAYIGTPSENESRWPYIAKTVVALQVAGLNPATFPAGSGTRDLLTELRSVIAADGSFTTGTDSFKTALALMALARTSPGVPVAVVDAFAARACSTLTDPNYGAFGFDRGCFQADVDTTAMAIQALLAAGRGNTDPVVVTAVDWLGRQQNGDGSFKSSWGSGNTNSTGLAVQALRAAGNVGNRAGADRGEQFVIGLQLTCAKAKAANISNATIASSLRQTSGAIAYDASGWDEALTYGIDVANRDQWHRATSQAIFGLGSVPLYELTAVGADFAASDNTCVADGDDSTPSGNDPKGPAKPQAKTAASVTAQVAKNSVKVGNKPQVAIKVTGKAVVSGSVRVSANVSGSKEIKVFNLSAQGTATFVAKNKLTKKKPTFAITVNYLGNEQLFAAKTTAGLLPTLKAKLSTNAIAANAKAKLMLSVSGAGVALPNGKLQVRVTNLATGKRVVAKNLAIKTKKPLATTTFNLPKLQRGNYQIQVTYLGSQMLLAGSAKKLSLRVK